jgi:hypothetical protein
MRYALHLSSSMLLAALATAPSCSPGSTDAWLSCSGDENRAVSPEGWCIACVVESDYGDGARMTQVMLDFPEERCGSGAVAASGSGHGLKLRWLGPDTIEIRHPAGLELSRNASGDILQCGRRKVRVVLASE